MHTYTHFSTTYGLSLPHSEVRELVEKHMGQNPTEYPLLDLGCGRGRNSLYLQSLGYMVDARDKDEASINVLQDICTREHITTVHPTVYDINSCGLPADAYHAVISTVVLMFVDRNKIEEIITNMQEATRAGGYHAIVVAMDTPEHPCRMPFSSPFAPDQLRGYYKDGWEVLKYNENLGHLHKTDAAGNPIALQFATLVAQKFA